ncbi:hypothetical protein ABZ208_05950 [Streptomyces sp. NPDC006208]|uniref:hypothetical protein n=1 Tax=Streptomyces sp. NPDC006208 TaxID=3156734 RepID=UPI0033AD9DD2
MKSLARLPRLLLPVTAVAPLALALVACGTETAGTEAAGTGTAASGTSGSGSAGSGADRSELEARARAAQVAIENVYVTEVSGYEVAKQSVGVLGADGFSATYVEQGTGVQIRLGVDRGSMDAASCPKAPLGVGSAATGGAVECVEDGKRWYRRSGSEHEYVTEVDGRLVRVNADTGSVDRATLRKAAEAAHAADDAELDAVLPPGQGDDGQPVERGDLPPVGDGAPNNEVGTSG